MKGLSHEDNPKFRRVVIRDLFIIMAINLVIGLLVVVALFFAIRGGW